MENLIGGMEPVVGSSAEEVCINTLNVIGKMMKPGVMTAQLFQAITESIERSGSKTGLHPGHSQGLDNFERPVIDEKDALELREKIVIVIHPHVLLSKGGGMWMGDMFVMTERDCRRLHGIPQMPHILL